MQSISVTEVEYVAFRLARELMSFQEPIPDFQTRFPNRLESCLAMPFQRFAKQDLYPGLIPKASILFYLMVKNHPFQNGNKRVAVATVLYFLYNNNKWLEVDNQELYNFAVWVTQSPPKLKKEVGRGIEKFLKDSLVALK